MLCCSRNRFDRVPVRHFANISRFAVLQMERQQSEKRGTTGARITNYGNDPKSIMQGSTICDIGRVVERKRRPALSSHLTGCDINIIIVMMTCDAWSLGLSKPMKNTRNCIKYSFLKAFSTVELDCMRWHDNTRNCPDFFKSGQSSTR